MGLGKVDSMTRVYNQTKEKKKRRALRRAMPSSEVLVWSKLRARQIHGRKFRRQYSVGSYVIDFYCPELKLAVEIDGDSHAGETAEIHDRQRQFFIESYHISFLRFTNSEVHENLESVLDAIAEKICALTKERIIQTKPCHFSLIPPSPAGGRRYPPPPLTPPC